METGLWVRLILGVMLGATAVSLSDFIVRYKMSKNPQLVNRPFNAVLMGILSVLICSVSAVHIGGRISSAKDRKSVV